MNKGLWNIMQKTDGQLDIYLYDDIEGDGKDWWTGEKTESKTSANYIQKVLEENPNVTQINLYINSYGGDVKEGLGIFNQLKRHSAQKTAYIDGFACSIVSVIAMSCDKIVMGSNSLMMVHHAACGCYGNANQLIKTAKDLEVIDKSSCSSYLLKAGNKLNEETLNKLLDDETWLNAEDCLKYGLCDEIAGKEDDTITQAKQKYKQYIQKTIEEEEKENNIKVPEQFKEQLNNYNKLKQKFLKGRDRNNEK